MKKTLIIYYSYEGHTDKIAHVFQGLLKSDIKRIEPVKEISQKGFGKYMWGGAMVVMKREPKLKELDIDWTQYDTIWIGTPVWAWTFTPPILTLLKSDWVRNQDVVFFYTHDGGPGQIEKRFKKLLHPSNRFLGAIGFESIDQHPDQIEAECQTFIQSLNSSLVDPR